MSSLIAIDLLPDAIRDFRRRNPNLDYSIGNSDDLSPHSLVLAYLRNYHHSVSVYPVEQVPEGKEPGLIVGLDGIPGTFLVLPDRWSDDPIYQAKNFLNRVPNTQSHICRAEWTTKYIDESAPPRIHGTIPQSVLRAPFHHIPSEFTR